MQLTTPHATIGDTFALQDSHGRFVGNARYTGQQRLETLPVGGMFIDPRNGEIASNLGAYGRGYVGENRIAFTDGIAAVALATDVVDVIEMVRPDTSTMERATAENTREGDLIYVEYRRDGDVVPDESYTSIVHSVGSDEHGSYFGTIQFHAKSGTTWERGAMTTVHDVYRYSR